MVISSRGADPVEGVGWGGVGEGREPLKQHGEQGGGRGFKRVTSCIPVFSDDMLTSLMSELEVYLYKVSFIYVGVLCCRWFSVAS